MKGSAREFLKMTIELFSVQTVTAQYSGCREVTFNWFRNIERDEDRPSRPYAELILDYDPNDEYAHYTEAAVDEFFTEEEATLLKQYLDENHGEHSQTTISKYDLFPVTTNLVGYCCNAVGGGDDFYLLDKETEYSLPFKAWGYFDLRGCELIDNPGETYRGYLFVDDHEAGLRQETQQEARERENGVAA
jgi:hypothetical protein